MPELRLTNLSQNFRLPVYLAAYHLLMFLFFLLLTALSVRRRETTGSSLVRHEPQFAVCFLTSRGKFVWNYTPKQSSLFHRLVLIIRQTFGLLATRVYIPLWA